MGVVSFFVATESDACVDSAPWDRATDAALGLGAFAVFNQMLGGVGAPVYAYPAPVSCVSS